MLWETHGGQDMDSASEMLKINRDENDLQE
jgi:hypothetical protein